MADTKSLYAGSDTLVAVRNLRNSATKELVTGATVQAVVKDASGTAVAGIPNPLTFTEETGGTTIKGYYTAVVPDSAGYVRGDTGTIEVTAVSGTLVRKVVVPYRVVDGE